MNCCCAGIGATVGARAGASFATVVVEGIGTLLGGPLPDADVGAAGAVGMLFAATVVAEALGSETPVICVSWVDPPPPFGGTW